MLYTIAFVMLVLWLLGLMTSYEMGGLVHLLLLAAFICVVVRLVQRRRLT
jgi:hypothetical protein